MLSRDRPKSVSPTTPGAHASSRCSTGRGRRGAASRSTPTSGRAAGPTAPWHRPRIRRRVRPARTSFSPRPRISSCCSAPEAATGAPVAPRDRPELVLKRSATPACRVISAGSSTMEVRGRRPWHDVVDTTAAGDSFAAAYLADAPCRRRPGARRRAPGHRLAGAVVRHPRSHHPPRRPCRPASAVPSPAPVQGDARMTSASAAAVLTDRIG